MRNSTIYLVFIQSLLSNYNCFNGIIYHRNRILINLLYTNEYKFVNFSSLKDHLLFQVAFLQSEALFYASSVEF
jgi:hypothetical protein